MGLWSLESWFESRPRSHSSSLHNFRATPHLRASCVRDGPSAATSSRVPTETSRRVPAETRIRVETLRTCGTIGAQKHVAPACYEGAWVPPGRTESESLQMQGDLVAGDYSQLTPVSRGSPGLKCVA